MTLDAFFRLVTEMNVGTRELTGTVMPKTANDIKELEDWIDSGSELTIEEVLKVNHSVSFSLKPMLEDGLGYASYEQFFDKKREWWNNPSFERVVEHHWLISQFENKEIPTAHLEKVAELIKFLTDQNRFYTNNNIIVFFSKKPSEVSLSAQNPNLLVKLIRELDEPTCQAIDEVCKWLGSDTENEHFHSKKNAFSTALTDYLTEKEGKIQHDICDLLDDIVNIKNQSLAQYALYLEDFSYSKFVKKIEESVSRFTTRINDSLGKSVTQVLGLPVATAVFNLAKIDLHWESVISLVAYIFLCGFVLRTQQTSLGYLEKEFEVFEQQLPKQLKNDVWNVNKKAISAQLKNQNRLIIFLWSIILCAFLYAAYLILKLSGCLPIF